MPTGEKSAKRHPVSALGDGIGAGRHVNRSEWAISPPFHTMFNQLRYCDTVVALLVIYGVIRSPHAT
jgi:hypothetical protein